MQGSVMFLHGGYKLISYARFTGKQAVVVIMNNDYENRELSLQVGRIGVPDGSVMRTLIQTSEEGYSLESKNYIVRDNKLNIEVPKISAVVLVYNKQGEVNV